MDRERLLQTVYDALGRGDLETMRAHVHDDVEVVERLEVPGARVYRGVEEWERGYRRESETIEDFRVELLGVEPIAEKAVADVVIRMRGRGSGAEVEERLAHVVDFRAGRPSRWRAYDTREEARAVALEENVRELYELWSSGRLDDAMTRLDADIEWVEPEETIGSRSRAGRDAAREGLTEWVTSFDSYSGEVDAVQVTGDVVIVRFVQRVRAGGSTVDIETPVFHVWGFRAGRPARMAMYFEEQQAAEGARAWNERER